MLSNSGLNITDESAGADLVDEDCCGPLDKDDGASGSVSLFDFEVFMLVSSPNSCSSSSILEAPILDIYMIEVVVQVYNAEA